MLSFTYQHTCLAQFPNSDSYIEKYDMLDMLNFAFFV